MAPRTQPHRKLLVTVTLATASLPTALAGSLPPIDTAWTINDDGNWGVAPANWSNGVPNAIGTTARFFGDTPDVINVNGPVTLGRLLIAGDTSYTFSGSPFTFNNDGGATGDARISSENAHHVFNNAIDIGLFNHLDIALDAGSITFNGPLSGPTSNVDIFGNGPTTVLFNANNTFSQPITVNNATLGGNGSFSGVVIASANATIAPSVTLPQNATASLSMPSLAVNPSSTLAFRLVTPGGDSLNDALVVSLNGGLTINGGDVAVTANATGAASLGYYKIIQYSGAIGGNGLASLTPPAPAGNVVYTFDTAHDPGFIDLHRGFPGDANDNGTVEFVDFVALANNYLKTNKGWAGADFDNSGTTDFFDFVLLANNYARSIAGDAFNASPEELAALHAFATAHAAPEPTTLTLLTPLLLLALRRRHP